jgi:hypothetical protein
MTEAATLDPIREEAAQWLEDELQLMNDNGAHWIKGSYSTTLAGVGAAYCIKGASNEMFKTKLDNVVTSLKDRFGPKIWDNKEAQAEKIQKANHIRRLQQVAEVAIAFGIFKVTDDIGLRRLLLSNMPSDFSPTFWGLDTNAEMIEYLEGDMVQEHVHGIITNFNDAEITNFDDVRAAHAHAIAGLRDGTTPIEWRDLYNSDYVPELREVELPVA